MGNALVIEVRHPDGSVTIHSSFWSQEEAEDYRSRFIPADKVAVIRPA